MGARLHSDLRFAPAQVLSERRDDGTLLLRSPQKLAPYAHAVGEWLAGLKARGSATVPVSAVVADLELILARVPVARVPRRGPFALRPVYWFLKNCYGPEVSR